MKKGGLLILFTGTLITTTGEVHTTEINQSGVTLSGSLGMRFREVIPDSGKSSFHRAYTGEVMARNHIWMPWFGNWKGRLISSWENKENGRETENQILSGAAEVNLFHLSKFPFSAFIDVKDSRIDDSELLEPGREERLTRLGLRQSYSPELGGMNATLNLFHDDREDLLTGDTEKSTRGLVSGYMHRGSHRITTLMVANDRSRSLVTDRHKDWQSDLTHSYNPMSNFSLITSLGVSGSDTEDTLGESESSQKRVATNLMWRATTLPVTLRSDIYFKSLDTSSASNIDKEENETRGNLSLTYLPYDRWRIRGRLGALVRSGDVDEERYIQSVTTDYTSKVSPLGAFTYGYGIGTGFSNEINTDDEDEWIGQASFSHNLNRTWQYDWFGPIGASFTFGQDLSYENSSLEEDLGTLVNRISYSLSSIGEDRSTNLNLVLYDSRNSGRNDFVTQNVSVNAIHNQRLSRYSDFGITYNVNFTKQRGDNSTVDDDDFFDEDKQSRNDDTEYSSLEVFFHNNRLFKVRNLRFASRLRGSSRSLYLDDMDEDQGSEYFWENRIDYTIGKLDIDFRTTWVERPSVENGGTKTITLNVRRLF
ncbi:MAG: hypothetical protein N0E54_10390 [Candidatus Thiodiazotropha taylori]|nr:hypothetical protein [Candidatus Thiodiazotropha endolucinida]MCG8085568.1 hypothetical protein [Candidatus Thiodiazotropha taylori]MCW4229135.1 hypothetical protein [Candidatus Thiodiazotropha taylori]